MPSARYRYYTPVLADAVFAADNAVLPSTLHAFTSPRPTSVKKNARCFFSGPTTPASTL
jgi:hypothetical protein